MRFQNKVALVTGGASGIGKEVATRFVAEGGSVVINGRDGAKAEAVAREIDPTGKRVVVHAGDIALPATGEAVVKTAIDRFGRLDVLFNNAGIFTPKPFLEVEEAEYDRFLGIILKGKFFAAQAAAKAMKDSGRGGAIVQTGSMWALQAIGATPSAAYSAAKAGVHALTKEPGDRASSLQNPRERDRTRCDRDASVQHVPDARGGGGRAADLQRDASART
jgi:NAD(P)-dependent dehydrogenase (short-subunit alcohol dehydrogenase family)